jgi:hypothetical protein
MKTSRFTDSQIMAILKQALAGVIPLKNSLFQAPLPMAYF